MEMVKTNGHKLRRTVFWLVLLGGIGLLAFLFLYYSGYRFDWRHARFIQLGSVAIDVLPEGSVVYLNNQQLPKTTPAIFNSIEPGEYTIRIEHEGYTTVEFPITVRSKSATVINKIFLPPATSATPIDQPELVQNIVTERQLEAVQEINDWPIWEITGTDPVAVISGANRDLSLVDGKQVTKLDNEVTDVEANADLDQVVYSKTGTTWIVYTNFEPLKSFILSRQTAPFRDVLLIPQMQAVVLTDKNSIQLVEIGPNESLFIRQLMIGEDLHSSQLDQTGKILWFQDGEQWFQFELFK